LLSISGGSDLGLFEINEAARLVADAAHPDANIIFGAVIDDTLGDEVRVTVIAAGFDGGVLPARRAAAKPGKTESEEATFSGDTNRAAEQSSPVAPPAAADEPKREQRRIVFDDSADDDLDVPDFLK